MSGTPRVLLFDLETLPHLGYFWSRRIDGWLPYENIVRERTILCAAWKWLGVPKIHSIHSSLDLSQPFPDIRVMGRLSALVDQADEVVAQNGEKFDMAWLRTRLVMAKLPPLAPALLFDTKKELKRQHYNFDSFAIDYVADKLGLGKKIRVDYDLWVECMPDMGATIENRRKALKEMERYNRHDVRLLERVYKRIRPGVQGGLNLAHFADEENQERTCPHCGKPKLQSKGIRFNRATVGTRYRCQACGGYCWKPRSSKVPR